MFRDTPRLERSKWNNSEKWTLILNNGLRMFSAGMLPAAVVSFIVFRSTVARLAAVAFGAGFGVGSSLVDAQFIMGHDVPTVEYRIAEVISKDY